MKKVAITPETSSCQKLAEKLSHRYGLPLYCESTLTDYILSVSHSMISICNPSDKAKAFFIDFTKGKMAARARQSQSELLKKALGLKKILKPSILDATAGLGRDGFLMAHFEAKITLLENNPTIFLLLLNGYKRYQKENTSFVTMKIYFQNANTFLTTSPDFDIIYLDPMFTGRNKAALAKKEMQILQDITQTDQNPSELLTLSLKKARKRVVVKRHIHLPPLGEMKPDLIYRGKTVRFDVYLK